MGPLPGMESRAEVTAGALFALQTCLPSNPLLKGHPTSALEGRFPGRAEAPVAGLSTKCSSHVIRSLLLSAAGEQGLLQVLV